MSDDATTWASMNATAKVWPTLDPEVTPFFADNPVLRTLLAAERRRFVELLANLPAAVCFLRCPGMIFEAANSRYLRLVGGRNIVGKPILEALPELGSQGILKLLRDVEASGEPFVGKEFPVRLDHHGNGVLGDAWFDFIYQPVRDPGEERVHGIITHAIDVTDKVLARQEVERLNAHLRFFATMTETAPSGIVMTMRDGTITHTNPAWRDLCGYGDACVGMQLDNFVVSAGDEPSSRLVQTTLEKGSWNGVLTFMREDRTTFEGQVSSAVVCDNKGKPQAVSAIVRDVTAEIQAERERIELRERVITAQELALRELSTPLLPIARGVLAMPLVGTINDARASQIMDTLLHGIAARQAHMVIIDVTGVKAIDANVAGALVDTACSAQLLGAKVVVTGISPVVAQMLVETDISLNNIVTLGSLEDGIAHALGSLGHGARPLRR